MSRGFIKEDDLEHAGTDLPERPISAHPNYVTPTGALELQDWEASLQTALDAAKQKSDDTFAKNKIAEIERDMRYVRTRLDSAILVDPAAQTHETVLFGASVEVEDSEGEPHTFNIVGEDEANVAQNKVSWVSPLAKSLLGHKIGDSVIWQRPAGDTTLQILDIHYSS